MADARIRKQARDAFSGDIRDVARALQNRMRSNEWDPIPLGCVTCRGSGMHDAFEGDERRCPTCRGTGDSPGKPARLRLAAFIGHEPARMLLSKSRMPAKTGLEDHDIESGFRLANYTFGIVPIFVGLMAIGEARLEADKENDDPDIQEYELMGARQALEHCRVWMQDHNYKPQSESRWPGNFWFSGLMQIVTDDTITHSFAATRDDGGLMRAFSQMGRWGKPANQQLHRISKIMIDTYRKTTENLNDYEAWKLFKDTIIEWAIG